MRQIPTLKILVFLLSALVSLSVFSKSDKNKKHEADELLYGIFNPDPEPLKVRPDHHNRPLDKPQLLNHNGEAVYGFDISHYQGRVNFEVLSTDPHAGYLYMKASEGSNNQDDRYSSYYHEARRVGFKVGSYHFFRGNCTAREQFENFRSQLRGKPQDLIPIIDVEIMPRRMSVYKYMERLSDLLILCEKEWGRKPMIYTGQKFYNRYFAGTKFVGKYKFMIARYTEIEPELYNNDDFLIWQFTGSGSARGVRGHIDISRFVRGHTLQEIMF